MLVILFIKGKMSLMFGFFFFVDDDITCMNELCVKEKRKMGYHFSYSGWNEIGIAGDCAGPVLKLNEPEELQNTQKIFDS